MDGIDLITVTETISILTGALLLIIIGINKIYFYGEDYDQLRILIKFILYLMSGMLIFIRFNSPPAKLFLGDSGSIVLGAVMMIILIKITKNFGVIPTLLLPLYYIIDSGMTLVKRISRKENVFLPKM